MGETPSSSGRPYPVQQDTRAHIGGPLAGWGVALGAPIGAWSAGGEFGFYATVGIVMLFVIGLVLGLVIGLFCTGVLIGLLPAVLSGRKK